MKKLFVMAFLLTILLVFMSTISSAQNGGQPESSPFPPNDNPHYLISVTQGNTKLGDITLELFPDVAPKHCHHFDSLVNVKFYDGLAFHRVIPNFMIQGGDPNSKNKPRNTWGQGEPGQPTVPAEFSKLHHNRGILSTARRGNDINSATSQFFICVSDVFQLDGQYTIFGKVISGMDVADKIVNSPRDKSDNPLEKIEMTIKKINEGEDNMKSLPDKD